MFVKRYQAPAGDGEVLIDPPLTSVSSLLKNAKNFDISGRPFGGKSFSEFRTLARYEVLELVQNYHQQFGESISITHSNKWIVVGHEPDLFHPGVWLKNFVLAKLGREHRAVTLNLIVDNDVPKSASIRIPRTDGTVAMLPFDDTPSGVPYEEWLARNEKLFHSFPSRIDELAHDWNEQPMVGRFWNEMQNVVQRPLIADKFSRARRHFERSWGAENLELPVSRMADTQSFRAFAIAIINDARRFAEHYNECLRIYRRTYRIASRHHPVPELIRDGKWQEIPFWIWTAAEPKRRRAFVRDENGETRVRWNGSQQRLADPAIKLRPRALMLTLFARLALADMFIHGIGGAKYDELTEMIAERYFAAHLPGFLVVSGTLHLPLQPFPVSEVDWHAALRNFRDLQWNPQRQLMIASPQLSAERDRLLTMPTQTRRQRRDRYRLLRENLDQWRPVTQLPIAAAQAELDRIVQELRANAILRSREYPFILFSERRLCGWFEKVTSA